MTQTTRGTGREFEPIGAIPEAFPGAYRAAYRLHRTPLPQTFGNPPVFWSPQSADLFEPDDFAGVAASFASFPPESVDAAGLDDSVSFFSPDLYDSLR